MTVGNYCLRLPAHFNGLPITQGGGGIENTKEDICTATPRNSARSHGAQALAAPLGPTGETKLHIDSHARRYTLSLFRSPPLPVT